MTWNRISYSLAALIVVVIGAVVVAASASADTPRKSPDFAIQLPDGKQALLSDYRGKVVLVEFMFTTCPACQHSAQYISQMNKEFGPKGFQPLAVAFNPMAMMWVPDFVQQNKVNFPVGVASDAAVKDYLQISPQERMMVPQIVVIDRKGMIRLATPPSGADDRTSEKNLRALVDTLLKEPAPVAASGGKKKG
jgi:peroxiredoxin